ncbi:hypothetical protein [Peribacillus faecalis]|nr:hypothetical protein [Peribacillus faecalis]
MAAIYFAISIMLVSLSIAFFLSNEKTKKWRNIIWGITIMVTIAPSLSFSVGLIYAIIVQNGRADMLMWVLFPIFFLIGLTLFLIGIFTKEKRPNHSVTN